MIRLSDPQYDFETTVGLCIEGITGNNFLAQKIINGSANLQTYELQYVAAATAGDLHAIVPLISHAPVDPIIFDDVRKSELVKVYDQYFVPEGKPARRVYDALLNSAKERCPFCGGIGTPRNLDHFLPKSHFPQFSIIPRNLVPSCRDCNMDGKGHSYATRAEDQIIQPYSDNDRFFLEQWIFSTYSVAAPGEPGEFNYYVNPPQHWGEIDKLRAHKHFANFSLSKRYAVKAAELLGTILRQIRSLRLAGLDEVAIKSVLLQPGVDESPFINHWQRGMFQALMYPVPA